MPHARFIIVACGAVLTAVFAAFALAGEASKPNLVVEGTYRTPVPGYAWEPVSFTAYIRNSGGDTAEHFMIRLRIDAKRDGSWETASSVSLGTLAAGESRRVEWPDAVKLPQGTHAAEICADADGRVEEQSEMDNCRDFSLTLLEWYGASPGADHALDIVFVGDRYPDQTPFHNDVAVLKEYLLSREPFTEFASQINFYTAENSVYLGCRETVKDLYAPIDPPPTKPTGTSITVVCDQSLVLEAVKRAGVPYDKIVVLASGMNGGTGIGNFVFTGKEKRLFVHELGHGFGLLDEYVSTSDSGPTSDACFANCCTNLRCAAWGGIPGVQCILGCTYPNWYRSSPESIMRYTTTENFNAVSVDHLRKTIATYLEHVPPTVAITAPASSAKVSGSVAIAVSAADEGAIAKAELSIDGRLFAKWYTDRATASFQTTWDTAPLAPSSSYLLEAKAYDLAGNVAVSAPVTVTIASTPSPTKAPTAISPLPQASASSVTLATVAPQPLLPTPLLRVSDGGLILFFTEQPPPYYIVKKSRGKEFVRKIVHHRVYEVYPHLDSQKAVPIGSSDQAKKLWEVSDYRPSAWIRLPVTQDTETWKIWEVNDDQTKHWITCASPNYCAQTWIAHGGDPDGIYTASRAELDIYRTGPNVFLR